MLPKIKLKPSIVFSGNAKTTKMALYQKIDRKAEMVPYGKDSYFTTPPTKEERARYANDIKITKNIEHSRN